MGQRATRLHHPRVHGFTLVDLVMVLSILTVVTAIAVPRFAVGIDRYKADATARRVVADLQWARAEATARSVPIEVYFDFSGSAYFLYNIESIDRNYVDNWVQLNFEPYNATLVSAFGKNINDSGHSLFFDVYGQADQTGTIEVNVGSETRLIQVDGQTGKVAIQ